MALQFLSTPKIRFNTKFVNRLHEDTEVMTNNLAQHLVHLRCRFLRPQRPSKLRFHHRKSALDIRPLVVVLQKFVAVELEAMPHLSPRSRSITLRVDLERNVRHSASVANYVHAQLREVTFVGG